MHYRKIVTLDGEIQYNFDLKFLRKICVWDFLIVFVVVVVFK